MRRSTLRIDREGYGIGCRMFDGRSSRYGLIRSGSSFLLVTGLLLAFTGLLGGCSVMSSQTMAEAEPAIPFPRLVARAHAYEGRVVVVGGYVLEVRNHGQETLLVVLQAPLGSGQEPLNADLSEGRFMVRHDRFLDPEVFTKGRKVTVGGVVKGVTPEVIGDQPYGYLTLKSREIYLWAKQDYHQPLANPRYSRPYPYDDPRYDQFDYRRY